MDGAGSLASTSIRQPATRSARPNTSWQPPGSIQITQSSLFSSRARGRPSSGPLHCIRKGLGAKLHSGATMCERETEKHNEIKRERGGVRVLCASSTQVHLNVKDILVTPVFRPCFSDWNILRCVHFFKHPYLLQYKQTYWNQLPS